MSCPAALRHPVSGDILLTCDRDEHDSHYYHHDKIISVYWRRPYETSDVYRRPSEPKIYTHTAKRPPMTAILEA